MDDDGVTRLRRVIARLARQLNSSATGQGLTLEFDDSLLDHFADVGYEPQYGARELRRRIRSELETELAGAMLRGDLSEGDTVKFRYDRPTRTVRWEKQAAAERAPRAREREETRPAAH